MKLTRFCSLRSSPRALDSEPNRWNPEGVYSVRWFLPSKDRWFYVIVDDVLPLQSNGTRPLYVKSRTSNGGRVFERTRATLIARECDTHTDLLRTRPSLRSSPRAWKEFWMCIIEKAREFPPPCD